MELKRQPIRCPKCGNDHVHDFCTHDADAHPHGGSVSGCECISCGHLWSEIARLQEAHDKWKRIAQHLLGVSEDSIHEAISAKLHLKGAADNPDSWIKRLKI